MRRTFPLPFLLPLFLRWAAVGLLAASMTGCSTITGGIKSVVDKTMNFMTIKGSPLTWKSVVIAAGDGANQNSPVAVDIVVVFEDSAVEKIVALPAAKWFQTRADMLRTFPGSFAYKTWEVSPGQTLKLRGDMFGTPSVVGVFVFADYLTPGDHRMKAEAVADGIIVELGARDFNVSPYKAE